MSVRLWVAIPLLVVSQYCTAGVEKDKLAHLGVSTLIGGGLQYVNKDNYIENFIGCTLVGVGKEVYDKIDYGVFDKKDILFDMIGCGIGVTGLKYYQDKGNHWLSYEIKF